MQMVSLLIGRRKWELRSFSARRALAGFLSDGRRSEPGRAKIPRGPDLCRTEIPTSRARVPRSEERREAALRMRSGYKQFWRLIDMKHLGLAAVVSIAALALAPSSVL